MDTSPQRPIFWQTVHTLTLVWTSVQWPPLYKGLFFGRQSIHLLLFEPLYNGHLSTKAFFLADSPYVDSCLNLCTMATSLQRPFFGRQSIHWLLFEPLYNGHLSTTANFLADSPYIDSCLNLCTMATSLQRPIFWQTVHTLTLVWTSVQWPPLYNAGHFHLSLRRPLWRGSTVFLKT